jgi:RNA polymerase sigma-70 factor (ECF subfamily)
VTQAVIPTRWEKRVLVRIRRNDRAALGELFDQFSGSVYGLARRITGDTLVAETITRSVFLDVWHEPQRLAGGVLRERLTELARVAAVKWRDAHSASGERSTEVSSCTAAPVSAHPDAEEATRASAEREWAVRSLGALPADNRALVEAVLFDGQLLAKAAAEQGMGQTAAASRLGEALFAMRQRVPGPG